MIKIKTELPGPKSTKTIAGLKNKNGGWAVPYPFVHSGKGSGCYTQDIDGNVFLDFGSQVASNPLGYNNSELIKVVKRYSDRIPVKYAGQDFCLEEHLDLIEKITGISPKGMDSAFLVNSGAEAVENAIKLAMKRRPEMKFTVSMEGAFHGRTLGALSLHHSNPLHRKGFLLEANKKIPFDDSAGDHLKNIIKENGAESVGFLIVEHIQGEGGYRIASKKMISDLRRITKENGIPYIADEVQSGVGRTGKWWAFENYGIKPEVFSSAKALQVGACIASKKFFPGEEGAISSTWGGGSLIDMALGIKIIETIKKQKLLSKINQRSRYLLKGLNNIDEISNQRGVGLMIAFDLENKKMRNDFVIEALKRRLIVLGCGEKSIRVIPAYTVKESEIDEGLSIIEKTAKTVSKTDFAHKGKICNFMECGASLT